MVQILQLYLDIHQLGKYIASIEHACCKLKQGEADELRGEMKAILKKINPQV